jgi:hypothetical protein
MKLVVSTTIPIKLKSEANIQEHWSKPWKRGAKAKWETRIALNAKLKISKFPVMIVFVRIGRKLDFDNLVFAFKPIRDEIADLIFPGQAPGQADSDSRLQWEYKQEPKKKRPDGFRIEIYDNSQEVVDIHDKIDISLLQDFPQLNE